MEKFGGRKWAAFCLLLMTTILFVMEDKLTDPSMIRDVLLGLLAFYGASNVGAKWATKPGQPRA